MNIVGGPYIGGNYWTDYIGIDLDGDKLGDTNLPYNATGNIIGGDYLPLVLMGYPYIPGDVNNDNQVIGSDVTYLVRYFKGIGPAPPYSVQTSNGTFYPAADANGDCKNLGSDVTYLVNYFKGGPALRYCSNYPPIGY